MYVKSFKDLIVWRKSLELVQEIYRETQDFPREELYGLVSQMRRSAIFIPCNIAEGNKRKTRKEFLYFLRIADGSAAELETQLIISKKLYNKNFLKAFRLLEEVQKMLATIIRKL